MVTFWLSSAERGNDKLSMSSRVTRYRGLRCWSAGAPEFWGLSSGVGCAVATVRGRAWLVCALPVSATTNNRIVNPIARIIIVLAMGAPELLKSLLTLD